MTNRSKQVRQSQHNRGLKGQTNPSRIVGGSTHRNFWVQTECHFSWWQGFLRLVTVATFQSAIRLLAKPQNTQSKSKPEGKRVLALASVRHQKSSPKTPLRKRRSPMSKAKRIQVRHRVTDCSLILLGTWKSPSQERQIWKVSRLVPEGGSELRRTRDMDRRSHAASLHAHSKDNGRSRAESDLCVAALSAAESKETVSSLHDLGYAMKPALVVDAKATQHVLHRHGIGRSKHIDVAYFWTPDKVRSKRLTWQISAPRRSAKQLSRRTPSHWRMSTWMKKA